MAATDVLTMGEAIRALPGITGPTKDADIEVFVGAVSEALDDLCGPIVQRPVTETHAGGTSTLILDAEPVGDLTSITERYGLTTSTVDLTTLVVSGRIVDRPYGTFAAGDRSISVTYTAGRFASTAEVTSRFKLAARLYLQAIWRPAEGGGSETFGGLPVLPVTTPDEVLAVLGSEVRAPVVA